jgi:hypothetical protein
MAVYLAVSHGSPIMHSLCLDYHCPDLQRFGGLRLGSCSSQRRNIAHQAEILLTHIRLFTRHFLNKTSSIVHEIRVTTDFR